MIIRGLCENLGENRGIYHAFPGPEKMAAQSESFYRDIGCGYRSPWVLGAAQRTLREKGLEAYSSLPTAALLEALKRFDGVGPKVADCIALFAYNRYEVFPVDTWVKKIYRHWFGGSPGASVMRKNLAEKFGDYAGIAQQYLFYYYRKDLSP